MPLFFFVVFEQKLSGGFVVYRHFFPLRCFFRQNLLTMASFCEYYKRDT